MASALSNFLIWTGTNKVQIVHDEGLKDQRLYLSGILDLVIHLVVMDLDPLGNKARETGSGASWSLKSAALSRVD